MKLAIFDIDDTIVGETKFMLNNAPKFLRDKYNIIVDEINMQEYDIREVYNLKKHLINQGYSYDEALVKAGEIKKAFWTENFIKYCMMPIDDGVRDAVEKLKKNGYKIQFVSLRGDTEKDFLFKAALALTKLQLRKSDIHYDDIKLVGTLDEKINYINSMNPSFVFEDRTSVLNKIHSDSHLFCITRNHNEKDILNSNVLRVDSFSSIDFEAFIREENAEKTMTEKKYDIFKKSKKIKNMNIKDYSNLRKILTEATYSIVTAVGTPVFNSKYHPIVKGKRNLLLNGPVAYIGTHRDKLDPVLVAATSSRSIHWAALLRMFQGKESLFSSTKSRFACDMSAYFLTSVGAVPIARKTDDDYMNVNISSINMLSQILDSDGAVGLFPEGTINRKTEEENILPLKSNRIFRLIKDSNGVIQPFSIVWMPKELDIENRVIINYGRPINTYNRSVYELRDLWMSSVNSGIDEANELLKSLENVCNEEKSEDEKSQKTKILINNYKKNM